MLGYNLVRLGQVNLDYRYGRLDLYSVKLLIYGLGWLSQAISSALITSYSVIKASITNVIVI